MKLYTYFRSSAAYRVRIALNLKGLSTEMIPVHLQKEGGLNRKPPYRAINPQMRLPALQLDSGDVLIQSLAIIEYLDELHPNPPLLPRDPVARAKVRALAQVIACDTRLDSTLSRWGRKSSSFSSDNFAGAPSSRGTSSCARSAWAAPSRIGPEFIIDRAA